jgi:hypothetical protein
MENLCTGIKKLHPENKNATIWIVGDMNLPDIDLTLNSVVGSNNPKSISQCMVDTIYDISSEHIGDFKTRGNNTLDLFITNRPNAVTHSKDSVTMI